ncbi:uncharacterized protein LOC120191840, partial [Hibiscus syriacus]|uniref:uncharacterized protein LOC120191840 n=1 Tax=Hibiscus syriacus TaxID=106335 RepID=UPI001920D85F
MTLLLPLLVTLKCCVLLLLRSKRRYNQSQPRNRVLKYLHLSLLLSIHMKEIILARSFNPHPIYEQGEPGVRLESLLSMILITRMKIGFKTTTNKKILAPEKVESLLFKLEVLDHKSRERAGVITPTLVSPIVLLTMDAAM